MKTSSAVVLALIGQLPQAQATSSVEITNPDYLPDLTLSEWKMFDQKERFDMYKQSELKVNSLNAEIARKHTRSSKLLRKYKGSS